MPTTTDTVREIALRNPASIRVFEELGLDYCCGGRRPLAEACAEHHLDPESVLTALRAAADTPASPLADWSNASLGSLVEHINATHHAYVRRELPRLYTLAAKVVARHGEEHFELSRIQSTVHQLGTELTEHLAKEEMVLFPYIQNLERARINLTGIPRSCFASISSPISVMATEHDSAGDALRLLRTLSNGYQTPDGACPTWVGFYTALREFEMDLHQHIHLENNILFPKAVELEASFLQSA